MGGSATVTAAGGVHGFPAALTRFIGRDGPLREVAGLLEHHRLVTVTGPGGSGKTRLAGQVAREAAARFADGAWLAELAPVQDPAQVAAAVAAALGVREQPGVPAGEAVGRVLARQQLLLVLDNCEHVIGAAAELCAGLLAACDDVRVLATSREPLQVAGEARYRLGPLSLPGPGQTGGGGSEAVALFADRARLADPHFTVGSESSSLVSQIVTRLDGIPLAIELAAARVESLGLAQLAARLDERFRLLVAADPLAHARQRSLAATVDWSYQLLAEPEQRVFRQLAVFRGPFTLEAAEVVAGPDAALVVLGLVDCSLLVPPRAGPDGRTRYLMLDTVRLFGAQRLAEAGGQAAAAAGLARYALDVAEQASAGLETSAGEVSAASWLDAEDAMTHQALDWALEHQPATALPLAIALAPWWFLRGRWASGYALLTAAAAHAAQGGDAWCAVQSWRARLAIGFDAAAAIGHYTSVVEVLAGRVPTPQLAHVLAARASCLLSIGHVHQAAEDARRALSLAREVDNPDAEALALAQLGMLAHYAGDDQDSLAWLRQTQLIDARRIPGSVVRRCLIELTSALIAVSELDEARQNCVRGRDLATRAHALSDQANFLSLMACLDLLAGQVPEAGAHLREAIELASQISNSWLLHGCLDLCGHLCAAMHRWTEAVTVWAAYAAALATSGIPDPAGDAHRRHEPLREARKALGPAGTRTAEDRGAAMTLAAATEYAMLLLTEEPGQQDSGSGAPRLSARERELVTLVACGRTDAQIAAELYISVRTVRSHLDRIRDKTGCRRRADLTRLALSAELV